MNYPSLLGLMQIDADCGSGKVVGLATEVTRRIYGKWVLTAAALGTAGEPPKNLFRWVFL